MRKNMAKKAKSDTFLICAWIVIAMYTVGLAVYSIFWILKSAGKIRIINQENLPRLRPRMAILPNHPDLLSSMAELFVVFALLYPQMFWHPIKFAPWFTPDKRNFGGWLWHFVSPRAIFVRRDKGNGRVKEARGMLDALNNYNGVLMHYAEEGRTGTGTDFQKSKNRGMLMRPLKKTIGWLILKTRACALPIWLENGEIAPQRNKKLFSWPRFFKNKPIIVKIGKLISFESMEAMTASEISEVIQANLLRLADQEE